MTIDERDQETADRGDRDEHGGDYGVSAGRDYDGELRRFVRSGRVADAARAAASSLDGPDAPALHDAEVAARREGAMPEDPEWMARVRTSAHRAIDKVLSSIVHAEAWMTRRARRTATASRSRA